TFEAWSPLLSVVQRAEPRCGRAPTGTAPRPAPYLIGACLRQPERTGGRRPVFTRFPALTAPIMAAAPRRVKHESDTVLPNCVAGDGPAGARRHARVVPICRGSGTSAGPPRAVDSSP